jgi:ribose transport system substrate-binding protein
MVYRPRRLFTAVATAIAAAALIGGCGVSGTTEKKHTVAFVAANSQLDFAVEMIDGFRYGAGLVDGVAHVEVGPPTVDGPRELQLFQNAPKSPTDGITVFTLSPELFAPPMAAAARAGIPVVAVDNPPAPGSHVGLFIGNDNYQLGQMLADQLINRLPPKATGTVVIGTTTPGVAVLDLRAKGMRDELNKRQPHVTVMGPFDTKQDTLANFASWQLLVQTNPHALAFLGTGDADGWNLAAIRRQTHGTWLAGAYDLDPRSLQAVKEGNLLLVSPEHFVKGAVAGQLQADHAKNGTALPTGWIFTPGLDVTPANVDQIIARQASTSTREAWFASPVNQILHHLNDYLRPLN